MRPELMISGLVSSAPALVAWTVGIWLSVRMLRRGGARAERFLLAGASVMLFGTLIAVPQTAFATWMMADMEKTVSEAALAASALGIVRGLFSAAGIACLFYAFWVKFRRETQP